MQTIAIYHNKGGVGKTTAAVNLAAAFQNKGKRVLLIDIDAQANATFSTGLVKFQFEEDDDLANRNIFQVLESAEFNTIPELVRKSHQFNSPEVDIIPSHISLIDKQDRLTRFASTRFRLSNKLQQVEDLYDIVVIDSPPSRDIYAEIALMAADYLVIPSDMKPFANQGLNNVKAFLKEIDESRTAMGKPPIQVLGILPSKISTNSRYLTCIFPKQKENVINRYQLPILETVIYERVALSHCLNQTIPVGLIEIPDPKSIFEFDPNCDSVKEFRNLSHEIITKIGA